MKSHLSLCTLVMLAACATTHAKPVPPAPVPAPAPAGPTSGECDDCGDDDEEPPVDDCDSWDDIAEGSPIDVSITVAEAPPIGTPVFNVACSGTIETNCGSLPVLVCGIDTTSYPVVAEEAFISLVVRSVRPIQVEIDRTPVKLTQIGKRYEGTFVFDVKSNLLRAKTARYERGGTFELPFNLVDGGRQVAGTIALSEVDAVVRGAFDGFEKRAVKLLFEENPPWVKTGVLVLEPQAIAAAFPVDLEAKLSEVRYLGWFHAGGYNFVGRLCEVIGGTSATTDLHFDWVDRWTGKREGSIALPPIAAGQPCDFMGLLSGPSRWPFFAYADLLGDALASYAKLGPAAAIATATTTDAAPWQVLGLARPTVRALLAKVGGDRVKLATVLGGVVPGVRAVVDGNALAQIGFDAQTNADTLLALGLDPTQARLIGKPFAAALDYFGAPNESPSGKAGSASKTDFSATFKSTSGGVVATATVSVKWARIAGVAISYVAAKP